MPAYIYRLSQWIEKKFNAKGGNVINDIDQVAAVYLPWLVGVEDRYLQGWNRFGVQMNQPAVAAQQGLFRLRNPAGSNVIVVVESILFISGAAAVDSGVLNWQAANADLASLVSLTTTRIDPRGNPQPTSILSFTSGAAPPILQQINIPAGQTAQFVTSPDTQYVVLPGQALNCSGATVNTAVTTSWLWREKALELSELT